MYIWSLTIEAYPLTLHQNSLIYSTMIPHHSLSDFPFAILPLIMDKVLNRQLFKSSQHLAQQIGLDPDYVIVTALIGALVLLSVLITLLVWLRYLVMAGLVVVPVTILLRWRSQGEVVEERIATALPEDAGGMEQIGCLLRATDGGKALDNLLQPTTEPEETSTLQLPSRGTKATENPSHSPRGNQKRRR